MMNHMKYNLVPRTTCLNILKMQIGPNISIVRRSLQKVDESHLLSTTNITYNAHMESLFAFLANLLNCLYLGEEFSSKDKVELYNVFMQHVIYSHVLPSWRQLTFLEIMDRNKMFKMSKTYVFGSLWIVGNSGNYVFGSLWIVGSSLIFLKTSSSRIPWLFFQKLLASTTWWTQEYATNPTFQIVRCTHECFLWSALCPLKNCHEQIVACQKTLQKKIRICKQATMDYLGWKPYT